MSSLNCSLATPLPLFTPLAAAILLLLQLSPMMGQKTWDGGANTNSWADANNWNPNQVPQPHENILLLGATVVLPAGTNASVKSIELCCETSLTIAADGSLTGSNIIMQHASTMLINDGYLVLTGGSASGLGLGGDTYFENNGIAEIYNSGANGGIQLFGANMENSGNLLIDGTTSNGDGIHIINYQSSTSFVINHGSVTIRNTMGDGISGSGYYSNYGSTTITDVSPGTDLMLDGEEGLDFQNLAGGQFFGSGVMDPTTFAWSGGDFSPDDGNGNPGVVSMYCTTNCGGEDFSDARLVFDVEGMANAGMPGGHDQVTLNQNAQLGGIFEVIFRGNYTPVAGDHFVLMTYGSKSGPDPIFLLPDLPPNLTWETAITNTKVEITVTSLLPVELTVFDARQEGSQISLKWTTASEMANMGFYIEKSADGRHWNTIAFVDGAGHSTEGVDYFFQDLQPFNGNNYYRLRQEDFDGSTQLSDVAMVDFDFGKNQPKLTLYPTPVPAGQPLYFTMGDEAGEVLHHFIFDSTGRLVGSGNGVPTDGIFETKNCLPGIYSLVLQTPSGMLRERFVVME